MQRMLKSYTKRSPYVFTRLLARQATLEKKQPPHMTWVYSAGYKLSRIPSAIINVLFAEPKGPVTVLPSLEVTDFLEAVEEFVESNKAQQNHLNDITEGMHERRNKVIRNTVCIDELMRDWGSDTLLSQGLKDIQQKLQETKEDGQTQDNEVNELQDELNVVKGACVKAILMLHSLLQELHLKDPQPQAHGTCQDFTTLVGAPLDTAFSPCHNDKMMMGVIEDVFNKVPLHDIRPETSYQNKSQDLSMNTQTQSKDST